MLGKVVKFVCGHERFYWFAAMGVSDEKIEEMATVGRIGYCRTCWADQAIVSVRDLREKEQRELEGIKRMFDDILRKRSAVKEH